MSAFLSLLGWSFLPNLVTGWTQAIYYGIMIRAGDPKPRPGSARYAEHRRRIHILVVTLYLLYTIYEADFELRTAGTFYNDLGVSLDATERDVKSRFRRLAALFHPDKVGTGSGPASRDAANAYFLHLKTASDVLSSPEQRFAYERFGPDVVKWQRCVTIRDYVYSGLTQLIPYYAIAAVSMYVLGLLGYVNWGRHERWLVMALLSLFEYHTVTRPTRPALLDRLVNPALALLARRPPYLPFQAIAMARKLCVTLYIAMSQIGPLLLAGPRGGQVETGKKGGDQEMLLRQGLDRLETMTKGLEVDSARLLETEMAPYAGDPEMLDSMQGKIKEWLVQNTIRSDPLVRDALGRSLQRRRVNAPPGARGTR